MNESLFDEYVIRGFMLCIQGIGSMKKRIDWFVGWDTRKARGKKRKKNVVAEGPRWDDGLEYYVVHCVSCKVEDL